MKSYFQSFLDIIFPKACMGCGGSLLRNEQFLCTRCELELPINPEIELHNNSTFTAFSGRLPLVTANTFLYFSKNGIAQHLIHQLKYQDREDLGFELGKRFGFYLKKTIQPKPDLIIPVPLHPSKQIERGYNQCHSIAKGLAASLTCAIEFDAVLRQVANPSQTKLNRASRWDNVKGIFELKEPSIVKGKHVLLIDDTLTTGATLESCGLEVLKAGGSTLSIATLAYAK